MGKNRNYYKERKFVHILTTAIKIEKKIVQTN